MSGERTLRDLEHARGEIVEWVAQLPPTQRQRRMRALRQVLNAAVAWERMLRNPASGVPAGAVRAPEVVAFADTAEVDAIAYELGKPWAQLVVVATETGCGPRSGSRLSAATCAATSSPSNAPTPSSAA